VIDFVVNVTVKMLDGAAVFCQRDNCEKPAVYLFSSATTRPFCAAHCSEHALELASRSGIELPSGKITGTKRWLEASA
jgi:hypothetical protein